MSEKKFEKKSKYMTEKWGFRTFFGHKNVRKMVQKKYPKKTV